MHELIVTETMDTRDLTVQLCAAGLPGPAAVRVAGALLAVRDEAMRGESGTR